MRLRKLLGPCLGMHLGLSLDAFGSQLAQAKRFNRTTLMATQDFVRSLRADGMEEDEIRRQLRGAGYKTGRISQLLAATRASGSADLPLEDEAGRACHQEHFSVSDLNAKRENQHGSRTCWGGRYRDRTWMKSERRKCRGSPVPFEALTCEGDSENAIDILEMHEAGCGTGVLFCVKNLFMICHPTPCPTASLSGQHAGDGGRGTPI